MDRLVQLITYINNHPEVVGKVVDFNPAADELCKLDLTENNTTLHADIVADSSRFSKWINQTLTAGNYKYGIGGYLEHRTIYARSKHFDTEGEPRRLHLGVDIWGEAGSQVYTPLDGKIHSFKDNSTFGDYGPTIILQHNLDGLTLYSLYGHLSRKSLDGLKEGMTVTANQQIATFGDINKNGGWPPHLHFQLMFDMEGMAGDYPGVCRYSEKERYRLNIPDPNIILQATFGGRQGQ